MKTRVLHHHLVAYLLIACFALTTSPGVAFAQDLEWDERWPRFSTTEAFVTGALGATAIMFSVVLSARKTPVWDSEFLLDLPVREFFGARGDVGERRAAFVSDGLVLSLIASPFLVGAGGATVKGGSTDVGAQLAFISLESFAAALAATNVTKILVGRSRPRLADCFARQLLDPAHVCEARPTVSFFSGHSAAAFTGAGLLCVMSNNVPIYGDGFGNDLPCYTGLAAATTTALLRVVANQHHFSDILVGAVVGLSAGWTLPYLLHFRQGTGRAAVDAGSAAAGNWSIPVLGYGATF